MCLQFTYLSTSQVQQGLDVHVIGSQYKLKQQGLVDVHIVGIPSAHHIHHLVALQWLLDLLHWIHLVLLQELNHLFKDSFFHVGEGDLHILEFLLFFIVLGVGSTRIQYSLTIISITRPER